MAHRIFTVRNPIKIYVSYHCADHQYHQNRHRHHLSSTLSTTWRQHARDITRAAWRGFSFHVVQTEFPVSSTHLAFLRETVPPRTWKKMCTFDLCHREMKTKSLAFVMLYSCMHFFNLGMFFARCLLHKYNILVFIMHTYYHACRAIKMTELYTPKLKTQSVVILRASAVLFYH